MSKKITSSIAGAALLFSFLNLFSRGIGFLREIVYAASFGFDKSFDIYLVGSIIPLTLVSIIFYIFQNYYIPLFNKHNNEDLEEFFNNNLNLIIIISLSVLLILLVFSNSIVALYLNNVHSESFKETSLIFRQFSIAFPVAAINSYLLAFLLFKFEYIHVSIAQVLLNISIILSTIALASLYSVFSISLGFIAGNIFQMIYLLIMTNKKIKIRLFHINLKNLSDHVEKNFYFILVIEIIGQLYLIVDRYFFSHVETGGVAALNYGYLVFQLPIILISASLSTVIFPKISKNFADNSMTELKKSMSESIKVNLLFFVPITFLLLIFGGDIINVLFQYGKFNINATLKTYNIVKYLSVSILFYSTYVLIIRYFYSINLIRLVFYLSITQLAIKIICNLILVKYLKQDGLALSTTISYFYFYSAAYWKLNKNIKLFESFYFAKKTVYLSVVSLIIACFILMITQYIFLYSIVKIILFLSLYVLVIYRTKDEFVVYFDRLKDIIVQKFLNYRLNERIS